MNMAYFHLLITSNIACSFVYLLAFASKSKFAPVSKLVFFGYVLSFFLVLVVFYSGTYALDLTFKTNSNSSICEFLK